jgi:hypothetical protein
MEHDEQSGNSSMFGYPSFLACLNPGVAPCNSRELDRFLLKTKAEDFYGFCLNIF